jgi:tetratricopeptide (TPR) repeat protein
MHLPAVANALPAALSDANYLPSNPEGGAPPPGGFGEADFGDLGMPGGAPDAPPPPAGPKAVPGGQGGVGFGELDFGAGGESAGVEADVVGGGEPAPMAEPGAEAALDEAPRTKAREKVVIDPRQGRIVKLAFAGVFALGVAGALLELTHYGAFARHVISDAAHKGQWTAEAADAMAAARKTIGGDLYDKSRAAADGLAAKLDQNPRSQMLKAVAALAEYEGQERFGRDGARATRADGWLKAIEDLNGTPGSVPFYTAAAAGRAATQPDLAAARTQLDAAAQKDTGDPIQADVALMRGELELRARDAAAANKAFTRALQVTPSAWGHFGLARAYFLAGDRPKVQSEIAAVLAATPNHPGALVLKATIAWGDDRDDSAVIEALKPIIDGPAKTSASAPELSRAYTLYGEAQASRGDVGAARTAFESALKLDATNGEALIGQGEVFFADGRYTEALSRFDTAVQADPSNPTAIVADAKAKIALERLSDAKTQLVTAQKAMPKNMMITYWLGKVEEKLGNKKGAEDAYVAAIGLTNPKDRDAIQPYVALSTLLAGQGRASEAADKLNEGRAKLPDSTAMQEALGQIAAAQGLFDDAITHYHNAVSKDPNDLRALFLLGDTYLRMRKLDDASAAFDKVAALDKDYPSLSMRRGELLEASGHLDEALQQFKAAAERAPKDPDLQLRVGAAYVGIGRGEEALKVLKPVYDERQNSAEVNHYLGRAHLLLGGVGHLKEAARLLSKAVDIEPSRAEYHLYLAWEATEALDWKLAEVEVEKAIKLDQLLGDAYWQRAVIEEVKGNVDDAIKDTEKALQLHPSRTEAHATLARCYADKNQPDKALKEWAIATAHTERPDWEYLYGRLLYEKSGPVAALQHVLAAAKAGQSMTPHPPWLGPVEFMTAEGLLKQGNKVDAKEHFLKFMDVGDISSPDRKDAIRELHKLDPEWHAP